MFTARVPGCFAKLPRVALGMIASVLLVSSLTALADSRSHGSASFERSALGGGKELQDLPLSAFVVLSSAQPIVGLDVDFSPSVAGGSGSYACSWKFGDGTGTTDCSGTHRWTAVGGYTVTLRVSDNDGQIATANDPIEVVAPSTAGSWIPGPRLGGIPVLVPLAIGFGALGAAFILRGRRHRFREGAPRLGSREIGRQRRPPRRR